MDRAKKFSTEWNGKLNEQWGIVKEVIPYSLAKYGLFAPHPYLEDKPESLFMMSYDLTTIDDATKLDFIQDDYRPNAVKGNAAGLGLNEAKLWSDLKRRSPTVKLKSTLIIV